MTSLMNVPLLTFQCVLGDGSATPVREYVDVTVAVEPNVEINAFGTVATVRGKLDHFLYNGIRWPLF